MDIVPLPHDAHPALIDGSVALTNAVHAADSPWVHPETASNLRGALEHGWDGEPPLTFVGLDGNDVVAVAELMRGLVAGLREGDGPVLVEADTYRWHGHYEGDPLKYREPEELTEWQLRDPLTIARDHMEHRGINLARADAVDAEVTAQVEAAIVEARLSPFP